MTEERCRREPLGGGRCELDAGHQGMHCKTSWPYGRDKQPFIFEWTDESQTRLSDKWGSRFD